MRQKGNARTFILVLLIIAWWAVSPSYGESMSLTELLMSKLNVSETQAQGGAGSIFQLAKDRLSAGDFGSISQVVPGMDKLLGAAPKAKGGVSGLSGLSSIFGNKLTTLEGLAGVTDRFSQLGLNSEMVGKFIPIILDYVKGSGGEGVMNLLKGALTG